MGVCCHSIACIKRDCCLWAHAEEKTTCWLKDREEQKHFKIVWAAGIYNLADYPTKHHFSAHHKKARPICLHEEGRSPRAIKECEAILASLKPAKKAMSVIRSYKCLLAAAAA